MASGADESKDRELTDSPEVQFPDSAEALGTMMESIEERLALCDVVFQDLLAVQRILKEKGLCDASFQEQNESS
ncbi:hypothetical protein PDJAM_G00005250 [Pangasius djambal]|uniref:Uncharacterized protein n=1 Tax=Pangasius djambal TaxID=1691987 RepID=A0ACC5XYH3_9TELE|nr:hypothetical protein [Pangasius djambal]